jgi:DNA-binding transcriptional ArsR family regulator
MNSLTLRARAVKKKLLGVLQEHPEGLTITELVDASKLSRSAVLIELARLEGANRVAIRRAGMAKICSLMEDDGDNKR